MSYFIADENKVWYHEKEASVGSNYGCEREYYGTTYKVGLTYKFEVPNDKYNVSMGFYDPWSHDYRLEDILIIGNVVAKAFCPNKIMKMKKHNKLFVVFFYFIPIEGLFLECA